MNEEQPKKWKTMFVILIAILFTSLIASAFLTTEDEAFGYNTAVIPIKGVITSEGSSGLFDESLSSAETVKAIEKAKNDPNIKAVIFEINSPGGSPVATDEISESIKELHKNNITTVAWIKDTGASGAYWIASSTEHIVANRMSIVGSIGVYASYLELYGLLNDYNVTYKRLVAGEYKDSGTPFRPMSSAEEIKMQEKLDKLHAYFITAVAENRNMSKDKVKELATGEIYLGIEAKENGLVDELGGQKEAIAYIENKLNTTVTTKEFVKKKTFFENMFEATNKNSYYIGQGIASGMLKDSGMKITT